MAVKQRTPKAEKPRETILVVDDEAHQRNILQEFLSSTGDYEAITASSGKEALELLKAKDVSIVLTDLSMPEMNGIELIKQGKKMRPESSFVIVTAHGTLESAIEAIKVGASDYLLKPVEFSDLSLRLSQLSKMKKLEARTSYLEQENKQLRGDNEIIAESNIMKSLFVELQKVSETEATVTLTGETGVGKEIVARFIHEHSSRCQGPFIAVNCSAIPDNLLESEFFGHEKGAFTGAEQKTSGLFQMANNGTLFLDEIGEMDIKLQPKILRAIEEKKVRRIGGTTDQNINIRLVAATNRNLKELVSEGKFREDLFFRLNVVPICLPPLRERTEDIPPLVTHFVKKFSGTMNRKISVIEPSYMDTLKKYSFPGNIRELANVIERSLIYVKGNNLTAESLPTEFLKSKGRSSTPLTPPGKTLNELTSLYEKQIIIESLETHQNDMDLAAKSLGLSRSSLYAKVSKYGIK